MNVGVELSVNVTGLQKKKLFRLCPPSAVVFCCIRINFFCVTLSASSSPFLSHVYNRCGVCVCVCVSCIYWLEFCDVHVCLHLCEGLISTCPCACRPSSFHRCRLLLSSCCSGCHRNARSSAAAAPLPHFLFSFPSVTQNWAALLLTRHLFPLQAASRSK